MKTLSRWLAGVGLVAAAVSSGCADPLRMDAVGTRTVRAATLPPKTNLVGARVEGDWVVAGSQRVGWIADQESSADGAPSAREANEPRRAASGDGSEICWYLLTINLATREIVSERFLGCFPNGGTSCDDEQRRIANEYQNSSWVQGRAAPACTDIVKDGDGTANFTWAELNGYFQNGNPHSGYGWVQQSLRVGIEKLRADWVGSPVRRANGYPAALWLSSGYRCPHGNASLPDATNSSWHMEGRAVDIETRWLAGISTTLEYAQMTTTQQSELRKVYDELTLLSLTTNRDAQPWEEYPTNRHFHFVR